MKETEIREMQVKFMPSLIQVLVLSLSLPSPLTQ